MLESQKPSGTPVGYVHNDGSCVNMVPCALSSVCACESVAAEKLHSDPPAEDNSFRLANNMTAHAHEHYLNSHAYKLF